MTPTQSIYVVDDAADYRSIVQQVFRRFLPQYPLVLLADGQALVDEVARRTAAEPLPGLIVLDMDMKMSGIETLNWLKQQPAWQAVPVVMMSHRSDADFQAASYRQGAVDYLGKPMGIQSLQAVFVKLCAQWLDNSADTGADSPQPDTL
jgi:CheY-like chemotaxis protein